MLQQNDLRERIHEQLQTRYETPEADSRGSARGPCAMPVPRKRALDRVATAIRTRRPAQGGRDRHLPREGPKSPPSLNVRMAGQKGGTGPPQPRPDFAAPDIAHGPRYKPPVVLKQTSITTCYCLQLPCTQVQMQARAWFACTYSNMQMHL